MSITRAHVGILAAVLLAAGGGFVVARLFDPHGFVEPHADEHAEDDHAEDEAAEGFIALNPDDAPAAGVELVRVERGGGVDLVLPGRVVLAANAQSIIGAPVDGVIVQMHVAVGQQVARGAPIASMRSQQGGAIRAQVDAAKAALTAAEARHARNQNLFEQGAISRQEYETSTAETEAAQADVRSAEAQAVAMGSPNAAGVLMVRSAIPGVVSRIITTPGAALEDGFEIAAIADLTKTELVFDAPPASLGLIAPGAHIEARWTGGQAIEAEVTGVAPSATGGQAVVRARTTGPSPSPGTVVSGRLVGGVADADGEGLSVPSEAVQTIKGGATVFIAEDAGFRPVPVIAGRTSGGRTEIISGLAGHERIAGRGAFLLKAELSKGEAEHGH